jgi:hypothetical protein
MPRIDHILGEGNQLAKSQMDVLALLELHPDHVFQMHPVDLFEIQLWLIDPSANEPPSGFALDTRLGYTIGTLRWDLSTLYARGKIGSIKLHRRTYYGSHEAIRRAAVMASRAG